MFLWSETPSVFVIRWWTIMKKDVKMIFSMLTLHPEFTSDFNISNDISTDINCKYVDVCMFCNPWCAVLQYLLFTSCGNKYPPGMMNTNKESSARFSCSVLCEGFMCKGNISVFLFILCIKGNVNQTSVTSFSLFKKNIFCIKFHYFTSF